MRALDRIVLAASLLAINAVALFLIADGMK